MAIQTLTRTETEQVSGAAFLLNLDLGPAGFVGACNLDTLLGTLSGTLVALTDGTVVRTFNYSGLLGQASHVISFNPTSGLHIQNLVDPILL